ncbi:shieldin complex subunit 2 isoform X2 [Chelmon rostratus]|uniref:shieldin complex subunit 2 isoform X2 n=1 Tax=Chelmon rostratus TaxID=109905 RepID=UPI001BE8781B|nr:shieldin complex subunit 2 isoform X2 [Chelmon rostratus]
MCERPKVHVFLGAPPPSSGPASTSGAGADERPPADWRHLELTWQDGRLRPADEAGNRAKFSSEDVGSSRENTESGPPAATLQSQDQDGSFSNADWITEVSQAQEDRTGSACRFSTDNVDLLSDSQRPAERFLSRDKESDPGEEDQCSSSVHEYLDSCFPAAQSEPKKPEPEHPHCSENQSRAAPPLSAQTQYLSSWTLSQTVILRGKRGIQSATSPETTLPPQTPPKDAQSPPSISSSTPELFSPVTPSPGASAELFSQPCPTPRVEEGGVVLEATTDGVLCSQDAKQQDTTAVQASPSKSPNFKKARTSENLRTEASAVPPDGSAATGLRGPTTLLIRCDKWGVRYSVLVAVVHPCHLKEVKVKSGPTAGTFVPLASVVVTDQSGVEMKVVLWRRAAFWVLTVGPGDVLLITGLQLNEDRWRGETVLQSTFSSKLLNLGQITASTSPPVPQHVNARSLSSLCGFLRERRPLLVSLNLRPPQDLNRLPYATLRSLRVNTLVHAVLRVIHTHLSTAAVWDFHVLLVKDGLTADLPELHSTPWSTVQPLDPASRRARGFLQPQRIQTGNSSSVELDLDTLLSQKYSGDVELRVQVTAFHFQDSVLSQNAPQPVLDSSTGLDDILAALSGDVTYTGCGRCSSELDTDANGIYGPCYPCLPHTAVRRYYRPGVLTVSGQGSGQVCVQVPPVPLLKILEAPPDKLHKSSAPGSEVKHIQVAAERLQTLLSLPRKIFTVTVRSHFLCDENSVPVSQDFTLLDLQFPR